MPSFVREIQLLKPHFYLEGVGGGLLRGAGLPHGDLLLQLVGHLLLLVPALAIQPEKCQKMVSKPIQNVTDSYTVPLISGLDPDGRGGVLGVLEVCPVEECADAVVDVDVLLLVGQLVGRGQVGDGLPGGEQRQQVGREVLGHGGGRAGGSGGTATGSGVKCPAPGDGDRGEDGRGPEGLSGPALGDLGPPFGVGVVVVDLSLT